MKEKEPTRAPDALAAQRRRMDWLAVERDYRFEGPDGPGRTNAETSLPVWEPEMTHSRHEQNQKKRSR